MNGYIEKIIIKDFKSHKDTEIELSPYMNVIYGRPNFGKSNVIKALLLLKNNRPLGAEKTLPKTETKCVTDVEVSFSENNTISILREIKTLPNDKKKVVKAEYKINDNEPYTGFGKSVPDKVTEILNLSELNIQKQSDSPYLISDSGGEFSRTINRLTGMGEANEWLKLTNESVKTTNNAIDIVNKKISDAKILSDKYHNVALLETLINDLTNTIDFGIVLNNTKNKITKLAKTTASHKRKKAVYEMMIQHIVDTKDVYTTYSTLTNIKNSLTTIKKLKLRDKKISELLNIDYMSDYINTLTNINRLKETLKKLSNIKKVKKETSIKIQNYNNTKAEYLIEVGNNDTCPVCFKPIDNLELIEKNI